LTRKKNQLPGLLLALSILVLSSQCTCADALEVWVTNPWLSMLTSFIGGVQSTVRPLQVWDDNYLLKTSRQKIPPNAVIIAVNSLDAETVLGRNNAAGSSVSFIFDGSSRPGSSREENFLDPAVLPFIGLRTLEILSAKDPSNYDYYQRRLAEFQTRLDSTVIVGRNMIGDRTILDLTWRYGRWIQAAAGSVIKPPDTVKAEWHRAQGLEVLDTAIEEARNRNWIIVADPWTPSHVREMAKKAKDFVEMPAPRMGDDMILFLYDLYLRIWGLARKVS